MNKIKLAVFGVLGTAVLTMGLYSCSDEEKINNPETENTNSAVQAMSVPVVTHDYKIVYEGWVLDVLLEKDNSDYKNTFVFQDTINDEIIFDLDYSFNNDEEGWKYEEQEKALIFANQLKNIGQTNLETLNYMLDESYNDLFYKVEENNYDKDLFSIIAYLKSGTASNLRRIENGTNEIEGTISPSFLIGKSHFVFQEDLYFDIEKIQNDIDLLIDEAIDSDYIEDENLLNFIQNTNEEKIRFDSLYSFYVSKAEFKLHIDNIINEGISTYCYRPICFIGCGTDRGCCGSYSGCCYYSHTLCLIHDRQCATCVPPQGFPSWYCGPDCQPDTEDTRDVKILIGG